MTQHSARKRLFIIAAVSLVVLLAAPFVGARFISFSDLSGGGALSLIFFSIRIPRVLMGFLAGGGLAVCGMVFQAMFRNPLATPFTLGVSSGASFGAALVILLGWGGAVLGLPLTSVGAFIGALVSMLMVYGFASLQRAMSNITVLLAGIAVSFLFSSLIMCAQYVSDLRHSFQIVRWLMGGLEVYGYRNLVTALPLALVGLVTISLNLVHLNHLLTGEDLAHSRGVNVKRTKLTLFFGTSLLVSAIVAVCGPIGFVGMMVPHVCRMILGNDHRTLGIATFLTGGSFLVICDTIARAAVAPAEMPVGVITALLGGPFFLWILFRHVRGNARGIW